LGACRSNVPNYALSDSNNTDLSAIRDINCNCWCSSRGGSCVLDLAISNCYGASCLDSDRIATTDCKIICSNLSCIKNATLSCSRVTKNHVYCFAIKCYRICCCRLITSVICQTCGARNAISSLDCSCSTLHRADASITPQIREPRQSKCSQNTQNHNHHDQLDQGETFFFPVRNHIHHCRYLLRL
jgi:hypothetical protein